MRTAAGRCATAVCPHERFWNSIRETVDAVFDRLRPKLLELRDCAAAIPGAPTRFRSKYAKLVDDRKALRLLRYQLEVGGIDPKNRTVLDAGCGSGIYSVLFHLLGARSVEALDLFPENIAALIELVGRLGLSIRPRHCDVSHTELDGESVDVVYCTEAISHFHDWPAFVAEAARVLRPGGRIVISDWNNGANPFARRQSYAFWRESETGPFTADDFKPGDRIPYLYRRWMILRRRFPELTDEQVFHLGLRTAGLGGEELLAAGRHYVATGEFPKSGYRWGASQRRPEDAQRNEEPVDPREVVARLQAHGVDASALPHFGLNRSPLLAPFNRAARLFAPISLRLSRCYLVVGVKRSAAV